MTNNSAVMNKRMEEYFDRLWPICRSITGNGVRDSLRILNEIIPLQITEVPTGKKVFDWEIPKEWNIRDAWIEGPDGKRYAEFSRNNLHVVNYSIPVDRQLNFDELKEHLHTLPEMPDAIPYVTSYYRERWGFCLSQNEMEKMPSKGTYRVYIDSDLKNGSLTYGELLIPGETDREILISTYVCHPSLAVNELSGPLATAFLYQKVMECMPTRRFTYRFLFAPETIGVIAFLAEKGQHLKEKMDAGYVMTCVGHEGKFNYKRSKQGNTIADRIAEHILKFSGAEYSIRDFSVGGSDERQYCSAGFNLPVGSLMRTPYKEYPEYHTSADDKSIISFDAIGKTVDMYFEILQAMEWNDRYRVTQPFCELQLGKRGLYPTQGGKEELEMQTHHLLHFLSYADGSTDLITIAEKCNAPVKEFEQTVSVCKQHGLID
jgi:aminopeptidase-like protein